MYVLADSSPLPARSFNKAAPPAGFFSIFSICPLATFNKSADTVASGYSEETRRDLAQAVGIILGKKLQNYGCKPLPNPNKPAEDVAFDAFVSAVIKIWSISLLFSILAKHA